MADSWGWGVTEDSWRGTLVHAAVGSGCRDRLGAAVPLRLSVDNTPAFAPLPGIRGVSRCRAWRPPVGSIRGAGLRPGWAWLGVADHGGPRDSGTPAHL